MAVAAGSEPNAVPASDTLRRIHAADGSIVQSAPHSAAAPLPAARPFRQPTFARKVELAGQAILQPVHPPRRHRVLLRSKMRTIRNKKSMMTSPSITVLTVPCPLGPAAHSSRPATQ